MVERFNQLGTLSSENPHFPTDVIRLVRFVRRLVADHRKNPRPDVVTQLIQAEKNGDRLSSGELVSTIILLLIAGHETTVSFGQGPHYCIGAPLTRLEGEIAFATVFKRRPNIRLAVSGDKLRWRQMIELRGLVELPVLF